MPRRITLKPVGALLLMVLLGVSTADRDAMAAPRDAASGEDILLEVHPEKTRVYLHEATPVTVTLLVGAASVRNIGYPRVEDGAFHATEFSPPRQSSVIRNGREYATYEFSATLNPRKSGEVEWGPVELHYDLLLPGSGATVFFGAAEPRAMTVRSNPAGFSILPLPTRGRPGGFTGAVGQFSVTRQATPAAPRAGEPISVMTRITGVGNIDTFSCESISLPGVRAYPPKATKTPNRLNCEQVLLSGTDVGKLIIPAIRISFFDPNAGRYQTSSSPPITLSFTGVADRPTPVATPASAVATPPSSTQVAPSRWPRWTALTIAALALAMAIRLRNRRAHVAPRHNLNTPIDTRHLLSDAEAGLVANDSPRFHDAVFRLVQSAAAEYCRLPPPGMTLNATTQTGEPMPRGLAALFQECDAVRYGGAIRGQQAMSQTLQCLRTHLARPL